MADSGSATAHVTVTGPVYQPFAPSVPDNWEPIDGGVASAAASCVTGRAAVAKMSGSSDTNASDAIRRAEGFTRSPFSRADRCTTHYRARVAPNRLPPARGVGDRARRRPPARAQPGRCHGSETRATALRPHDVVPVRAIPRRRSETSHSHERRGLRMWPRRSAGLSYAATHAQSIAQDGDEEPRPTWRCGACDPAAARLRRSAARHLEE
jgi:hypothetical protein